MNTLQWVAAGAQSKATLGILILAIFAALIPAAVIIGRKLPPRKAGPADRVSNSTRLLISIGIGFILDRISASSLDEGPAFVVALVAGACTWALLGLIRLGGHNQ